MERRLALKREHLADLTSDDLVRVGAGTGSIDVCIHPPTQAYACVALSVDCLTGYYPSINAPCTTTN